MIGGKNRTKRGGSRRRGSRRGGMKLGGLINPATVLTLLNMTMRKGPPGSPLKRHHKKKHKKGTKKK
tara:strand:- start:769 stop:969 length:201 start_codon:yes stop_codon:yes gene_type:complete